MAESVGIRYFGRKAETIYKNVNINLGNKILEHIEQLNSLSGKKFTFNDGEYVSEKIDIRNQSLAGLSHNVENTFYNIAGSVNMIALSLIFIYNENIDKNTLKKDFFTVEKICPYYLSYYKAASDKKEKVDKTRNITVVKFVNFCLSFVENIEVCLDSSEQHNKT